MKKMSPIFPVLSIVLVISGALGLVMDFIMALSLLKNEECPRALAVIIIIFGLAWGIASIISGITSYKSSVSIIKKQRIASQRGKISRARINIRSISIKAILIVSICAVQMIFIVVAGVVIWKLLALLLIGIIIPLIYLISARLNA